MTSPNIWKTLCPDTTRGVNWMDAGVKRFSRGPTHPRHLLSRGGARPTPGGQFQPADPVRPGGRATPFLLGAALGWYFVHPTELLPEKTSSFEAMRFLGAGAMDDAAAWCLLAVVLASFDDNLTLALRNILGGIISPALFATLVIMAVVTTLMASPIFELLVGRQRLAPEPGPEDASPA